MGISQIFDYRMLAAIFIMKSCLQALGLLYVWRVERKYPPAWKWAIGSLLVAIGILAALLGATTTSATMIVARNAVIYAGMVIFGVGIVEACGAPAPWRFLTTLISCGLGAIWYFSEIAPSLSGRIVAFSIVFAIGALYIALKALTAPADPLRETRRLIGLLLIVQAVMALARGIAALQTDFLSIFQVSAVQTAFVLVSVAVSFMLALMLTALTGQRTTALLSAVLDNLDQGVALFDKDQRLVTCNARYGVLYGIAASQLQPGASFAAIAARQAGPHFGNDQILPVAVPTTKLHNLSDGRAIVISSRPMAFGGWLTNHSDVSAIRRVEKQVAYLAHHDALTGLANRQLFNEQLLAARDRLRGGEQGFAVLLLDLDSFKAINDTLGHLSGDALLMSVAERLRRCVSPADVVARLGGDEFAIVQMTGPGRETTRSLAHRLLEEIGTSYEIDGQKVVVGASIGIARAPENGIDVGQLMRNADLALYRSKAEGRNRYRFYDFDMDAKIRARHALGLALRNSITAQDFLLEYQPIVDVDGERVCGAEALVRWRHPDGYIVEPANFIGLAEETGLIMPLGEWILRRACSDARAWPQDMRVCVNLSVAQFAQGDICDVVEMVLQETGLAPERLELEVTESLFLRSDEIALSALRRLKKLGVWIALDDFGTGYSSLNYLTKFPFDRIKIDKSFIIDLGSRRESGAIVAAIIGVARSLDMTTTAEGVETAAQFELLRIAGCTHMQGYLFGAPRPVENLEFDGWDVAKHFAPALARSA